MKILNTKDESNHILLTCELDPSSLNKAHDTHFTSISKHVSVPGFRKGHAPMETSIKYLKSRGRWSGEFDAVVHRLIEKSVSSLSETDPELDKKLFGMPVASRVVDWKPEEWLMQVELKFEKFPEIKLDDYSEIPTLIEHKEPDPELCPVTADKEAEKDDVVALAMMGKNKDGDVEMKYTYDMLEIDLSKTKVKKEIIDAILGSKAKDKKELKIQDDKLGEISLELWIIEVRKKEKIDEQLVEKLKVPGITTVDQLKEAIKRQHDMHNSYVKYQDIMKWLMSKNNEVLPFPAENVRREAVRMHEISVKRGRPESYESIVYTHTKNLKQTLVINEIAKQEQFEVDDKDKEAFAQDIDSQPWLYGNRKSEDIFNCSPEVLKEYVLQFKTVKFLMEKWKFSA